MNRRWALLTLAALGVLCVYLRRKVIHFQG